MNKSTITYKFVSGVLVFFVTLCLFTSITFWTPSVYAESYKAPLVKRKVKKQKPNNKAVNSKGARGVKAKKHDGKKAGNKKRQVKVVKNGVSGAKKQKNRDKKANNKADKTKNKDNKQALSKALLLNKIGAKNSKNYSETPINGLAGLSRAQAKTAISSAQVKKKGSTVVGHALSKHAGRNPKIWGKMSGSMKTWNDQGMKHFREIIRGKGDFKVITSKGINFLEKRLADGRGIWLNMNSTFKTFID